MASNNFLFQRPPVMKWVTYVLSNGASLRMPIATEHAGPRFATLDVFNHNVWKHNIETEASLEASKDVLPDMSDYYSRYGGKQEGGQAGTKKRPGKKGA